MARQTKARNSRERIVEYISREEARRRLDRRARRALGISGEEFLRRLHAGELEDSPKEIYLTFLARLVE